MKKIKILQLASFEGNIGDNANHCGSRLLMRENLQGYELDFTELEIREFFWKERKFDDSFATLANDYDLVVIGGGNYFELWVDSSCNGTTVDIPIDLLKKINPPIVFYALGLDPAQGVTEERISKFKTWLDYVLDQEKYVVSVRNDGSMEAANELLGEKYASRMHHVPDGGFFTQVGDFFHPEIPENKTVIGLNLAGDMLDVRFNDAIDGNISDEDFLTTLGDTLSKMLYAHPEIHLVFFCHIYKDLAFTSRFLHKMSDPLCRKRVTVAPYLHGEGSQEYIFDAYSKCDLIMGNRFHTNVCAIGLNVPTVGFVNYRQIQKLYEELNIIHRTVEVNKKGFEIKLERLILESLAEKDVIKKQYADIRADLLNRKNAFHQVLKEWLDKVI